MIDVHTHIIPNIDDGSKSVEETFNLISEAEEAGFTDIILTPHYITNYYETTGAEVRLLTETLQKIANEKRKRFAITRRFLFYGFYKEDPSG